MPNTNVTSEVAEFLRAAEDDPNYRDLLPRGLFKSAAKQLEKGKPGLAIKSLRTCLKSAEESNQFSDEWFVGLVSTGSELDEEYEENEAADVVETEQEIAKIKKWIGDLS